jgi:hypothetical protein
VTIRPGELAAPTAGDAPIPSAAAGPPAFAHASEAELARILDYYQVVWQYEPRTFPILFNLDGAVVESFAPDFYLPEFDLYVELTTLKQSLVRKKNRKLRRLRELYPDVRIKLFYARDFKALLLKYGRFDLAASLSGQEGQARPADIGREMSVTADATMPAGPVTGEPMAAAAGGGSDGPRDATIVTAVGLDQPAADARPARTRRARRRRRAGRGAG